MTFKRKVLLVPSLSLSLITCALALYRVPFVFRYDYSQPHRSLFASIECFASCAVANAIVLNSFVRDKGAKRNKFRGPGGSHTVYSLGTIARRGITGDQERLYALDEQRMRIGMKVWGSDEDLVKETGIGMSRDLQGIKDTEEHDDRINGSHRIYPVPRLASWEGRQGNWERDNNKEPILPLHVTPVASLSQPDMLPWEALRGEGAAGYSGKDMIMKPPAIQKRWGDQESIT